MEKETDVLAEAARQQDLTELLRDSLHWLKASMPEKPYMPSEEYRATVMGKLINDIELSLLAPPSAPVLPEPTKHCDCEASTGVCGSTTRGTGKLDFNGYWEFPCTHHTDAVLPEGQPQKEKEFRARYLNEWPKGDTSGEGQ